MALHIMRHGEVAFDDTSREAIADGLQRRSLSPQSGALAPLSTRAFDQSTRFLLCDTPNADGGMGIDRGLADQCISALRNEGLLLVENKRVDKVRRADPSQKSAHYAAAVEKRAVLLSTR
ncbi:hypothetical protein DL1_16180 [Thioclava dalianensis]|uniref:Phosphoglycerate mutase n=1 Tax=Thioclava dalianensis TaxID=1185766 RepID=A0A074TKN0_9RHOB|nr:hypothetical protein [Thioclava dalianensis]KEP70715.1 hypothetical protein DL1_16180 [Thioclava dalianensis]